MRYLALATDYDETLAEDGEVFSPARGRILLQQPTPLPVELDADFKAADNVYELCFFDVGFCKEWGGLNVESNAANNRRTGTL